MKINAQRQKLYDSQAIRRGAHDPAFTGPPIRASPTS